jgi:hypothetical protein
MRLLATVLGHREICSKTNMKQREEYDILNIKSRFCHLAKLAKRSSAGREGQKERTRPVQQTAHFTPAGDHCFLKTTQHG